MIQHDGDLYQSRRRNSKPGDLELICICGLRKVFAGAKNDVYDYRWERFCTDAHRHHGTRHFYQPRMKRTAL